MKLREDTVFYRIGQWIFIPAFLGGLWFSHYGYGAYHQLFACTFRRLTGLPCPGCGGTRAVFYLFRGNLKQSLQYHPVVLYGAAAYLHFMGTCFYRKHISRDSRTVTIAGYCYLAIGIIIIQWIVKILYLLLI